MRWIAVVSGLAVAVIVVLMVILLGEGGKTSSGIDAGASPPPEEGPGPRATPKYRMDLPNPNQLPDETREAALSKENETNIQTFGQEFEKKWRQDREKLGTERHREMEKLWMEGRRPRGNKDSEARLEQILREFPYTNRAGCAAYELGHHYVRDRSLDLAAKRKKAEEAWKIVDDRYRDTLCEFNEPANAMSKIGLSMWVYRYTDKAMARRLLEEVIAKHKGETDHLGQRVEDLAGTLLEDLK